MDGNTEQNNSPDMDNDAEQNDPALMNSNDDSITITNACTVVYVDCGAWPVPDVVTIHAHADD